MRRSPAYIETPLSPESWVPKSDFRLRWTYPTKTSGGSFRTCTQNFIYPSLKCKWPIHTKLLAPDDLIPLSYRTQDCGRNDNVYYELKKKFDWNILVLPDQCSRTFWAFSRYRYRDTITSLTSVTVEVSLRWRHNERDCVSNHKPHDCLLNRLFRRR